MGTPLLTMVKLLIKVPILPSMISGMKSGKLVTLFFNNDRLKAVRHSNAPFVLSDDSEISTPELRTFPKLTRVLEKPVVLGTGLLNSWSLVFLIKYSTEPVSRLFHKPKSSPTLISSEVSQRSPGLGIRAGAAP